jgi:hypothetical protein
MPDADFDYAELLPIARLLMEGAATQAHLRSAANRAYYAAYGCLRKRITALYLGDVFGEGGNHRSLVRVCLKCQTGTKPREVGKHLQSLLRLRVHADYEWQKQIDGREVKGTETLTKNTMYRIASLTEDNLREIALELTEETRRRAERDSQR